MKLCKKCLLPDNFPHITFDKNGICNLCRQYKGKKQAERLKTEYRSKFDDLIEQAKGNGGYDILMCYSGGKDSTYTLSILKNHYKLKILAFTFDNGFVPERTYLNIRNVVEKLDVDHIFFKPHFSILKKIFKVSLKKSLYAPKALERASTVCTSCMGLVKYTAMKLAIEKEIPLIGFGWSPGQAPVTSSILHIEPAMMESMEKALTGPLLEIAGSGILDYFPGEKYYKRLKQLPTFVHPLAVFPYNEKEILRKIKALGWKMPSGIDLNATNCLLNSLADEAHITQYCFHPYAYEIAAFVREGYMTRREGLKHLPVNKNPKTVKMVKRKLDIRWPT